MNKTLWQRSAPHVIAIAIFFVISCVYCLPAFKGLVVAQTDIQGWKGMAQQSIEFKEKHGHFPLWTNSMFSGMPAFQIAMESRHNVTLAWLHHVMRLGLPQPASLFFIACVTFYILSLVLGIRNWIGIFGAIGYGFASYNAVLAEVGHVTKFAAMAYVPGVVAGLILLTQRKYVLGFIATLIFTTLLLYQGHLQVVYYTFLIAICIAIAYAVVVFRQKDFKHLGIVLGAAFLAGLLSIGSYALSVLPTYEYARETIRGGRSELSSATLGKAENVKTEGGLDKDYAFSYSYGIDEAFTTILPRYKGGSTGPAELGEDGKAVQALQEAQLPGDAINYFFNFLSAYWGEQPFVSGTVYFGALVCLFFIAGLFVVRNWHLGWIVAATILGFVLAWGSHLKGINYFLFDHLPFYNKFRAPSIALIIPQFTFGVLASLALQSIFYSDWDKAILMKRLKYALITVGAVLAILVFTYISADFKSSSDTQVREGIASTLTQAMSQGQQPSQQMIQQNNTVATSVVRGLVQDRRSLYGGDLIRTFIFIILGIGLVWLVVKKKTNPFYITIILAALNLADLIPVDLRYLNKEKFVEQEDFESSFAPNAADLQIKQDNTYFRVFDQSGDPFQSSPSTQRTSYHHNSIGGYHPAKLALYNDLIDKQLRRGNIQVYNMLNTKYFITTNPANGQQIAQLNPGALGPAWFIKTIKYVPNAEEEMKALDTFNPADTVIIDNREKAKVTHQPQFDPSATIQIVENLNDKITYKTNSGSNQFAVFSEVYYPLGWKAFIDGKEAPIVKVNYVLRGLAIPAGSHNIEFRFEPKSYQMGETISLISGIISILLVLAGSWWLWREYNSAKPVTTKK